LGGEKDIWPVKNIAPAISRVFFWTTLPLCWEPKTGQTRLESSNGSLHTDLLRRTTSDN